MSSRANGQAHDNNLSHAVQLILFYTSLQYPSDEERSFFVYV